VVEDEPGQDWEEVNHGPGRAADDRTVGIRATVGHRAVRVQTFAVEVGREYGVLQPIVSDPVVRVEDGREVADGVLATVGGRHDLGVYLIGHVLQDVDGDGRVLSEVFLSYLDDAFPLAGKDGERGDKEGGE